MIEALLAVDRQITVFSFRNQCARTSNNYICLCSKAGLASPHQWFIKATSLDRMFRQCSSSRTSMPRGNQLQGKVRDIGSQSRRGSSDGEN
jgi:hypothetical protein